MLARPAALRDGFPAALLAVVFALPLLEPLGRPGPRLEVAGEEFESRSRALCRRATARARQRRMQLRASGRG